MAVVDVLIRGKYEAQKAFGSLASDIDKSAVKVAGFASASASSMDKVMGGFESARRSFGDVVDILEMGKQAFNAITQPVLELSQASTELSNAINVNVTESSKLVQIGERLGLSQTQLTEALKNARENGIVPNTSGLADLADKYARLEDPASRAQFLTEKFGAAGANLKPLLEDGRQGVEKLTRDVERYGAVLDVVTQEKIERFNQAQLRLEGTQRKLSMEAGPAVMDFLSNAGDGFDHLAFGTEKAINAYKDHEAEVMRNASSYSEFTAEMMRTAQALKEYVALTGGSAGVNDFLAETLYKSTQAQYEQAQALAAVEEQYKRTAAAAGSYAGSVPIMGHGQSYKAGQGPAYPYSESNPTGYTYNPNTGDYDYPGRAMGGSMVGGVSYLVGERGPEIVTPGTNSTITPTGGAGGGSVISLSFPSMFPPSDPGQLERVLRPAAEKLIREMKSTGRL